MEPISPIVKREKILQELSNDKFVRETNKGGNKLYIIDHHDSPNTMLEIGRLRELTFRAAGGGTGKSEDIDYYDTCEDPYKQLIVWDPDRQEILGGYRYHICKEKDYNNIAEIALATARLFEFSEKFKQEFLPYTIELGRSFVQPQYQSTNQRSKGIYALDNLWDGLGALVILNPEKRYFFGKVTMYQNYNKRARNLILYFMEKHFPDHDNLVYPKVPIDIEVDKEELKQIFTGKSYIEDYKILSQKVRAFGENIPPLINAYMNLSPSMKSFGTVINPHFGNVEETAIMITINDLYKQKVERHIANFKTTHKNHWKVIRRFLHQ